MKNLIFSLLVVGLFFVMVTASRADVNVGIGSEWKYSSTNIVLSGSEQVGSLGWDSMRLRELSRMYAIGVGYQNFGAGVMLGGTSISSLHEEGDNGLATHAGQNLQYGFFGHAVAPVGVYGIVGSLQGQYSRGGYRTANGNLDQQVGIEFGKFQGDLQLSKRVLDLVDVYGGARYTRNEYDFTDGNWAVNYRNARAWSPVLGARTSLGDVNGFVEGSAVGETSVSTGLSYSF